MRPDASHWRAGILVDDCDQWMFDRYRLTRGGNGGQYVRAICRETNRQFLLARIITNCPDGMVVDHINGDKLDNRRANLRVCTQQENMFNRRSFCGTSRFKGVSRFRTHQWRAGIWHGGTYIYLGLFDTEEDAARAYDAKARELHGEFVCANFPEPGEAPAVAA